MQLGQYSSVMPVAEQSLKPSATSTYYPLKFAAHPVERIWGGHRLKSMFSIEDKQPIGEYWLLSSHPTAVSIVQNGKWKGCSLQEITDRYPEAYLGHSPQKRFPLLIKLIEANEHLSVQVHPDDAYARQANNDYGKTEAWYIVDTGHESEMILGHQFQDRKQFMRAARNGQIKEYLQKRRIERDELIYVPAGTVHAIMKGTILLEIQQTSDVTYRIYDWDRLDASGNARELHIEQAADVIHFNHSSHLNHARSAVIPIICNEHLQHEQLLSCDYFTIERIQLVQNNQFECQLGQAGNPDVLIVLEGEGQLHDGANNVSLTTGNTILIPATVSSYTIEASSPLKIIRTYYGK